MSLAYLPPCDVIHVTIAQRESLLNDLQDGSCRPPILTPPKYNRTDHCQSLKRLPLPQTRANQDAAVRGSQECHY